MGKMKALAAAGIAQLHFTQHADHRYDDEIFRIAFLGELDNALG